MEVWSGWRSGANPQLASSCNAIYSRCSPPPGVAATGFTPQPAPNQAVWAPVLHHEEQPARGSTGRRAGLVTLRPNRVKEGEGREVLQEGVSPLLFWVSRDDLMIPRASVFLWTLNTSLSPFVCCSAAIAFVSTTIKKKSRELNSCHCDLDF